MRALQVVMSQLDAAGRWEEVVKQPPILQIAGVPGIQFQPCLVKETLARGVGQEWRFTAVLRLCALQEDANVWQSLLSNELHSSASFELVVICLLPRLWLALVCADCWLVAYHCWPCAQLH